MSSLYKNMMIAVYASILGVAIFFSSIQNYRNFSSAVKKSHSISTSYDEIYINLVNSLERDMATRIQFSYMGKKDPMTGRVRTVAPIPEISQTVAEIPVRRVVNTRPQRAQVQRPRVQQPSIRLTAIIFNEISRSYTAMVMIGNRPVSLEVGDSFESQTVRSISSSEVVTVGDGKTYRYNIDGSVVVQ